MRRRRKNERGFTLILIVMLVAVVALIGVALLGLLRTELSLVGESRRRDEAREVAEGGAMEVLNDLGLPGVLPTLDHPVLSAAVAAPTASLFDEDGGDRAYQAQVNLLRIAPLAESSNAHSRAVVYEIQVESLASGGAASAELRTEVYRTISVTPGVMLPDRHFR